MFRELDLGLREMVTEEIRDELILLSIIPTMKQNLRFNSPSSSLVSHRSGHSLLKQVIVQHIYPLEDLLSLPERTVHSINSCKQ
jgi:hypothetical protein